ncbi:hypothetical protein RHGRI_003657 [Rhododendron griersonianum]|uniref:RRM domain-containing protein n=1 Tax=Rhododendron griersonianum TaxID=479676 RepID=A0AAV6L7L7_9ERIC|nr:hypothetical protein RHGRI_003657 [Rhododendron griersonianum]
MSSRSSRHKEKHGLKSVVYQESRDEGTAARTRPFSFDEIMLRRKNKKLSGDVEDMIGEAEDISVKEIEKVPDRSVSGRGSRNSNDALPVVKHASEDFLNLSSRKREDINARTGDRVVNKRERDNRDGNRLVNKRDRDSRDSEAKKQASEDILRVSSRKKEDNTAVTGERLVNDRYKDDRDRDNRDRAIKSRATLNREVSDKAKRGKDDRWDHGRRKNDERPISHSENQSENRHARNLVRKDRYEERSRGNSEKESKNKHRVEDDERTRERSVVKKNSSGKWDDSEASKRKLLHIHQEESRQKRRRSRSREHDKDRGRRSVSLSPRAQKRKSYNTSEQGELPSHSSKDKSRRQQSDDDRHRISSNGANNHYRRHGESTSQLGGYSPRKRKTEAAVKTPSPPHWSHPEKKSATWDLPPVGADSNLIVSVISNVDTSNLTVASNRNQISVVDPAKTVKALSGVLSNATIDSIQLTQATRPMRRIFVENLPASVSEKDVMEYLNNFLVSSGVTHVQGSEPCISCSIHKEKGQALVEFLTPEYASAALSFDGRSFSGSILKIRRPKDFVEVAVRMMPCFQTVAIFMQTGGPDKSVDAISDTVRDSSHKIFIGGISKAMSPEMLKEIVSAFGILKAYRLEVNADHNEPCVFLEYVNQSVTLKACAGLNGMRLGGQLLTAVLATPDAASSVENIGNSPFYGIPEHAKPLLEKPTQVLKLKNLLDPDSLSSLSEAELEEILEDTRLECARFGAVKSVNVVKFSDFKTNQETQEVCENPSSSNGGEDLNCKDKDTTAETSGEHTDFDAEEISRSEPQNNGKEAEEVDKAVEGGGICVEKLQDDILEDELCNPSQIDGKVDLESKDQMECCDNKVDDTIQTTDAKVADVENESTDRDKLESVEANGHLQESLAEMDLSERMDTDGAEKGENGVCVFGLEDVFEPGCVLVEYKRTEAASMAAHCLHGRVFNNRSVAVGYVDYEMYKSRFPK